MEEQEVDPDPITNGQPHEAPAPEPTPAKRLPWYLGITVESGNITMEFRAPGAKDTSWEDLAKRASRAIRKKRAEDYEGICSEAGRITRALLLSVSYRADGVEHQIDRSQFVEESGLFSGTKALDLARLVMFSGAPGLRIRGAE